MTGWEIVRISENRGRLRRKRRRKEKWSDDSSYSEREATEIYAQTQRDSLLIRGIYGEDRRKKDGRMIENSWRYHNNCLINFKAVICIKERPKSVTFYDSTQSQHSCQSYPIESEYIMIWRVLDHPSSWLLVSISSLLLNELRDDRKRKEDTCPLLPSHQCMQHNCVFPPVLSLSLPRAVLVSLSQLTSEMGGRRDKQC